MKKVPVEGLRELDRALAELPNSTGKAVLRRTLLKAGQPMADMMKSLAPDDPETGGRDLKSSISVGTKLSKRQAKIHRKMFKNDKASAEAFVGPGPDPAAWNQEFGNINHPAQSFARPAWDGQKGKALDIIKTEMWGEIDRAAKRLAKKAARG